jgi:hypothetical protein
LDLFLLLVIIIGGILAWQTGRERSRLSERHARLVRVTGDLPITDPSQVHIQALETDQPMEFAWRVYYPANYAQVLRHPNGGSSRSPSTTSTEFIARVAFRRDDRGIMNVYTHFEGSSGRFSFGDESLAELLRNHWDKLRVEQIGSPALTALKPDRPATLLRLTMSEELQDEARKTLSPHAKYYVPDVFQLELGPKASKP